tara:strand:- start:9005 stop:9319 length:315 start_codon:yes stop_codon:yes gene_type:complete
MAKYKGQADKVQKDATTYKPKKVNATPVGAKVPGPLNAITLTDANNFYIDAIGDNQIPEVLQAILINEKFFFHVKSNSWVKTNQANKIKVSVDRHTGDLTVHKE